MGIGMNTLPYIAAKGRRRRDDRNRGRATAVRNKRELRRTRRHAHRGRILPGDGSCRTLREEYLKTSQSHRGQTPVAMNPDKVALAAFALCTPMADYMVGETVDVDGGVLMNIQEKPFSFTVDGCIPGISE